MKIKKVVSAKKDNRIWFRAKPDLELKIYTAHKRFGFSAEAATVRQLVEYGLDYINFVEAEKEALRNRMRKLGIKTLSTGENWAED